MSYKEGMTIFPFVLIITTLLGFERPAPTHKAVRTEHGYKIVPVDKVIK